MAKRALLVLQLLGTLAILAFVPGNAVKAVCLLVWWWLTFGGLSIREGAVFAVACLLFTVMNALSLQSGIFTFRAPDLWGMPVYEVFMWGFYIVHLWRSVEGPVPPVRTATALPVAIAFALVFALVSDQGWLLATSAAVLVLALYLFHDRWDLTYAGYMVLVGALIEYTGVLSGEWFYPGSPVGGVPAWFITLWGGVGLLFRRLVLPLADMIPARAKSPAADGQAKGA